MLPEHVILRWREIAAIGAQIQSAPEDERADARDEVQQLIDLSPDEARACLRGYTSRKNDLLAWILLGDAVEKRGEADVEDLRRLLDRADLAATFGDREAPLRGVREAHCAFYRGVLAHAADQAHEAQDAYGQAERDYRDRNASVELRGLAMYAEGLAALEMDNIEGGRGLRRGARERFEMALRTLPEGPIRDDISAEIDRAMNQRQLVDELVENHEPDSLLAHRPSLVDPQLVTLLHARVIGLSVDDAPVELVWRMALLCERLAAQVGRPIETIDEIQRYYLGAKKASAAEWILRERLRGTTGETDSALQRDLLDVVMMESRYADARPIVEALLQREPDDADLLTRLGLILYELGDLEAAETELRRARELDPGNSFIVEALAVVRRESARRYQEQAAQSGTIVVDASAGDLSVQLVAGILAANQDRFDEVLQTLQQSDPDLANRALALLQASGNLPRPASPARAHYDLAEAAFRQARWPDALREYRLAIEADPNMAPAYMGWGDVHYRLGNYHLAVAYFEESIVISPDASTYRFLADSYRQIGKRDLALEGYRRALELRPNYSGARDALNSLLVEMSADSGSLAPRVATAQAETGPVAAPINEAAGPESDVLTTGTVGPPEASSSSGTPKSWLARIGSNVAAFIAGVTGRRNPPATPPPIPTAGPPISQTDAVTNAPRHPLSLQETGRPAFDFKPIGDQWTEERFDGLVGKMAERVPCLPELLEAGSKEERIAIVERNYDPDRYEWLLMLLGIIEFHLKEKVHRLDDALALAELNYELALRMPHSAESDSAFVLGRSRQIAEALQGLGGIYRDLGQLSRSLEYWEQAEAWYATDVQERHQRGIVGRSEFDRLFHQRESRAILFENMARLHYQLGSLDRAREYGRRAAALDEAVLSLQARGAALLVAADGAERAGDDDRALGLRLEAVDIAVEESSHNVTTRELVTACFHVGSHLRRLQAYRTALRYLQRALELNKQSGYLERLCYDYQGVGLVFEARPDLGNPLEQFEAALACASEPADESQPFAWRAQDGTVRRVLDPDLGWPAALAVGRVHRQRASFNHADRFFALAIALSEAVRSHIVQDERRIGLQGERSAAYEAIVAMHGHLAAAASNEGEDPSGAADHAARAWIFAERARGRSFLDTLGASPLAPPPSVPVSLVEREDVLLETLRSLSAAREDGSATRRGTWDQYAQTRASLADVWHEMQATAPDAVAYVELRRGEPLGFSDALKLLAS